MATIARIHQSTINANERAPGPATGKVTSTPVTLSMTRSGVISIAAGLRFLVSEELCLVLLLQGVQ